METFPGRGDIAELASGLGTRLVFAHALLLPLVGFEFEVGLDFCCEIFCSPFAPEHRLCLLGAENQSHGPRQAPPLACLFRQLVAPSWGERIEARLAVVLTH